VVNVTNGAVSDADARAWALASNRDSLWYRWAEANVQPSLLPHLGLLSLDPSAEIAALAAQEPITQPDCALFPIKATLFPVSSADSLFSRSLGETVTNGFAFVAAFPGPCTVTARTVDGRTVTIASYPTAGVTFFAGQIRLDPVLGKIWFADGAGNCGDRGATAAWCK
jgi:hypothetical protein